MCLPEPPLSRVPRNENMVVRSVWADNLEAEFDVIRNIIDNFPFVSMDTEFPGVVVHPVGVPIPIHLRTARDQYRVIKNNVDITKLIQVGLTLSDSDGNLPDLGTNDHYIWEFNFRDFDLSDDFHALDSINVLREQGIDFVKNRELGIQSFRFSELMMSSGLVCNEWVSWITFHGGYDFAYLIKALTGRSLPAELGQFLGLLKVFFGPGFVDVKYLIKFCNGLHGGLNNLAELLGVERTVGRCHQAGSDSLLTWLTFHKIWQAHFSGNHSRIEKYAGVLFTLEDS